MARRGLPATRAARRERRECLVSRLGRSHLQAGPACQVHGDPTYLIAVSLLSECGLRVQGAELPQARFTETTAASCFSLDLVLGLFLFAGLTESGLRAWLGPGRRRGWRVKGQSGLDDHCGAVPERDCQCSLVIHQ